MKMLKLNNKWVLISFLGDDWEENFIMKKSRIIFILLFKIELKDRILLYK